MIQIKKLILILLLFLSIVCRSQINKELSLAVGNGMKVLDKANVLSKAEVEGVNELIETVNVEFGLCYSVCLIKNLNGLSIEKLAFEIREKTSETYSTDKAIAILISEQDRKVYISTSSEVDKVVTNRELQLIVNQEFVPELHKGDYFEALKTGILVIQDIYSRNGLNDEGGIPGWAVVLIMIVVAVIFIYIVRDFYALGGFDFKERKLRKRKKKLFLSSEKTKEGFHITWGAGGSGSSGGSSGGGAGGSF